MKEQADLIREHVQTRYAGIVQSKKGDETCCDDSCCGGGSTAVGEVSSTRLGYSESELAQLPEGADLSLGCGNPQAIASLKPGETVLDLGSGAGIDCFLAANQVGESGTVIGVDMTPAMIARAKENARQGGFSQVSFRLGEIEHLPLSDASVDVIISNCVINLSPEKEQVFAEAYRVLKPGGRLAISDVVASAEIPEAVQADLGMLSACISGASTVTALENMLEAGGFQQINIRPKEESREFIRDWVPGGKIEELILSASIQAVKPAE